MGIELRHNVLAGQVNFEYQRLCDLSTQIRKARAKRELDMTCNRYVGYCGSSDSLVLEIGALMVREGNYYEAESLFDYTFQPIHSERLAETRREIDEHLLALLESAGWSEARLRSLRDILSDRLEMERTRREEMVAYADTFRDRNDVYRGHVERGHYAAACDVLTAALEELREACKELEVKVDQPI